MRLFEAIVDANHRALAGDAQAGLHPSEFPDSLPVVALTCIDPRLNPLMPAVLGIPEEKFIWLRNAGNIIFDPMSSMMRTLALACAIKGGREIAIIGHTDCLVGKASIVQLTERFRALGIERAKLPDNLNEFFGLFASERQNVIKGAGFVRNSPLIGPKIPVHGLLVDIQNGKLEWLVNGYQSFASTSRDAVADRPAGPLPALPDFPAFQIGEMKFPEAKIGETIPSLSMASPPAAEEQPAPLRLEPKASPKVALRLDPSAMFKIMGEDRKIYGPVAVHELVQWIADGRIDGSTLAQKFGYKEWRPLASFMESQMPAEIPFPPPIPSSVRPRKGRKN